VSCTLLAALVGASIGSGASESPTRSVKVLSNIHDVVVFYSVLSQEQYVNNADDRARGEGSNPFGNYSATFVPPPPNEELFGPFPGDEGEYAYKLYTRANHKTSAGSAIFVCQYNFNESSFCDASFRLRGGIMIAKGSSNFNSTKFTLAVVGGTQEYRGMSGTLEVSALGSATQAQPVHRAAPMIEEQRLALLTGASSISAKTRRYITAYSTSERQTFIDNNDDEARGDVNNPFGKRDDKAASIIDEHANGPFPGDEALFSFVVYANSSRTTKAGVAVYTCQYYFDKNAFCDGSYRFTDGSTMFGAGTFNFDAKKFALAITGGSGRYGDAKGDVEVSPVGEQSQRLFFVLS
jgi:hypothetical protein